MLRLEVTIFDQGEAAFIVFCCILMTVQCHCKTSQSELYTGTDSEPSVEHPELWNLYLHVIIKNDVIIFIIKVSPVTLYFINTIVLISRVISIIYHHQYTCKNNDFTKVPPLYSISLDSTGHKGAFEASDYMPKSQGCSHILYFPVYKMCFFPTIFIGASYTSSVCIKPSLLARSVYAYFLRVQETVRRCIPKLILTKV